MLHPDKNNTTPKNEEGHTKDRNFKKQKLYKKGHQKALKTNFITTLTYFCDQKQGPSYVYIYMCGW